MFVNELFGYSLYGDRLFRGILFGDLFFGNSMFNENVGTSLFLKATTKNIKHCMFIKQNQ